MRNDTGETTATIISRSDDRAWKFVHKELLDGATLLRIPKLKLTYCVRGNGPAYGAGVSDTRIRKLERAGMITHTGVDRYALATP